MTELYTIKFKTKKVVNKFDDKGKLISKTSEPTEVVMHGLPYTTAKAYETCDVLDFEMTKYEPSERYHSRGSGRDKSVGNGTRSRGMKRGEINAVAASSKTGKSSVADAAQSGDLSRAISN